jgi:hypothetical protein
MQHTVGQVEAAGDGGEKRIDRADERGGGGRVADMGDGIVVGGSRKLRPGVPLGIEREQEEHDDVDDAGADKSEQEGVGQSKHRT